MAGKMHIQVVMHRPTTPKYGCYAPGCAPPPLMPGQTPCEPAAVQWFEWIQLLRG